MIEVIVVGMGVAPPSTTPLLLLKERTGERVLPIGVGPAEAQAIVMPLQGVRPPRPMTHDVFVETISRLGGSIVRVEITELTNGTFHARLTVLQDSEERAIDIRSSDAVALAVRTEAPIFVADEVLDEAAFVPSQTTEPSTAMPDAEASTPVDESKLTQFKEFIETLDIDDLGPPTSENRS
jgi:bifunctional DNase/RNase